MGGRIGPGIPRKGREQNHEIRSELACEDEEGLPDGLLVFAVEGPFFFGAVENFERALAGTHTDPRILIIRLRWVPFIDVTGLQTLEEVIEDLHRRGVRVVLTGANARVAEKLRRARIVEMIGEENFFAEFHDGLRACEASLHKKDEATSETPAAR